MRLACCIALLALMAQPAPFCSETEPETARGPDPAAREWPTAGGRLMWDSGEELDLIAAIWADLPHALEGGSALFLSFDLRTAIEKAESDFTFALRDTDYILDLGWRRPLQRWRAARLSFFGGQRQKILIDNEGRAGIRYVGAALESPAFRAYRPGRRERAAWRIAAGPVLQESGIEADLFVRGRGRLRLWPRSSEPVAGLELDAEMDGLLDGGDLDADITAGPSLVLPLASGNIMRFFAHYRDGRNPLGVGHSSLLVGYEYSGRAGSGRVALLPPEIGGVIAVGGGDERQAARFRLGVRTPPLAKELRIAFVIDANLLTAEDTDELYYFYHLGLERRLLRRQILGVYFYHRSNHQLDHPNDRITSINVLEAGLENDGWHDMTAGGELRSWGRLDGRARLGYLMDSSFGEARRWHIRGGLRWLMPLAAGAFRPFIQLEAEEGDVGRRSYALGSSLGEAFSARIEYRDDEQYFGSDRTALLLLLARGF